MDKSKITYEFHGKFKGREEVDAMLSDLEALEKIPNGFNERKIRVIADNCYQTRATTRYTILDGNNLIGRIGEPTETDFRNFRHFIIEDDVLVEGKK